MSKNYLINLLKNQLNISINNICKDISFNDFNFEYVIFKANSSHILNNIEIVISNNTSSDLDEFKIKVIELYNENHNLKYAIFCDKDNDLVYYKISSKGSLIEFFDLTLFRNTKSILTKKDLIKPDNFEKTLKLINNYLYANEGLSPNQIFDELIKLLFIKLEDEKKDEDKQLYFYIDAIEYESIFCFKNDVNYETQSFRKRIQSILDNIKTENSSIFNNNDSIRINNKSLAYIVSKLQYYSLGKLDSDIKGIIFQNIIDTNQKVGRGQFFTPQAVVQFIISIIDPDINSKYIDTSCGTGGFLKTIVSYVSKKYRLKDTDLIEFIKSNIHGIEINPDIARIAKIRFFFENQILNDNIICEDALSMNDTYYVNYYDIIVTNPPFGTQGKIIDKSILAKYDLGYMWKNNEKTNKVSNGQVPDILFIEKCLKLLKNKGILAIILPNGDLENSSLSYVRKYILNKSKLLASIKLPDETFVPYGTGVKSSILFLQKLDENDLEIEKKKDYTIFFGEITKLGYSFSKTCKPIYITDNFGNKIQDVNGKYMLDEDFTHIINMYRQFKLYSNNINSKHCFTLSFSDLENRFDYSFYRQDLKKNIDKLKKYKAVPLKSVVEIVKYTSDLLKNKDNTVRYIEISNINTHSCEIINFNEMRVKDLPSRAKYQIKTGDIITSVSGNSIGTSKHATAYVTEEYNDCICTNGLRVLRSKNINPLYLLYYLRTPYFLMQVEKYRTGAAIPNISDEDFSKILVYIPDDNKLNEIINSVKLSFEMREKSKKLLNNKIIDI